MSMISSQCDERLDERLRRAAQTCRELGKHTTANMFLEAADTILELRDDLQRANDATRDAEHDESMVWDRVRKAEAENAKLRRMVRVYRACHDHTNACRGCEELPECDALRQLRELGREVGIEVG